MNGQIAALWNEGKTTPEIADFLEVSRGVVMGRLNKMGLLGFRKKEAKNWNERESAKVVPSIRRFTWETENETASG